MPVCNFRLTQSPAQVNLTAVHPAREVDEAGEQILPLDAQALQLFHELPHPILALLEIVLKPFDFFTMGSVESFRAFLKSRQPFVLVAQRSCQFGYIAEN